ncbi:putative phage holin [Streptomyces sp. 1222.5]|uniref:putative phage holin n=1 Tax=Streptomyces sp. 1222.5 TaxID=1881026 RepID=UPI003D762B5F
MSAITVDQWVNAGASLLAAGSCAVFAVTYHLRATWWRSEVGRNLMGFAATVCLLCLYTVAVTVWQEECWLMAMRALRTLVLVVVAGLMVQRTRLFLKAQRESRGAGGPGA